MIFLRTPDVPDRNKGWANRGDRWTSVPAILLAGFCIGYMANAFVSAL